MIHAVHREIFWYRYFGLSTREVPVKRFGEAFWLHLTIEFPSFHFPERLFVELMGNVTGIRMIQLSSDCAEFASPYVAAVLDIAIECIFDFLVCCDGRRR